VRRCAAFLAVLAATTGAMLAQDTEAEILSAVNAERARMDLEPVAWSRPLQRLAQLRANEITAGEVFDFELGSASELLLAARELGYSGSLAQELTSVADGGACEVVEAWNESLGRSDAYRRPEVREVGVGFGVLGENALTVLVVGAPPPPPGVRKRWPGNVPREWLTGDLLDEIDRKRVGMALTSFVRNEELAEAAQALADEILTDATPFGRGRRETAGGTLLYFKTGEINGAYWGEAMKIWLAVDHAVLARPGPVPAGAGLASRGTGGYLQAAWTVLVGVP
jgi:hypothetical protein